LKKYFEIRVTKALTLSVKFEKRSIIK